MATGHELKAQGKAIATSLAEAAEAVASFQQQAAKQVLQLEADLEQVRYPGLHLPTLLGPLTNDATASDTDWIDRTLLLIGSGPWPQQDLHQFLDDGDFAVVGSTLSDAPIVILGAHGWSANDLEQVARHDPPLRLYTQELLVLGLARRADPLAILDDAHAEAIAESHDGIQQLLQLGFVWPAWGEESLDDDGEELDYGDYDTYEWRTRSVLSDLGYSAREDGPGATVRRAAMVRAMTEELNTASGDQERWGRPKSTQRLAALVAFMLWLNRFQSADKPAAREIRLEDLQWLQSRYDPDGVRFEWPELTDNGHTPARKRTPNAAFMKPLTPSPALAEIVGSDPMPRTEVVSKLWAYVKKHKLQDNVNKRMVNADAKLRVIFGKSQVSMFEMAGLIGKHVR